MQRACETTRPLRSGTPRADPVLTSCVPCVRKKGKKGKGKKDTSFPDEQDEGSSKRGGKKGGKGSGAAAEASLDFMSAEQIASTLKKEVPALSGAKGAVGRAAVARGTAVP